MPWIIEFWALVLIWPDPMDWLAPDIFAKDIANIWALYEWLFCPFLLEILNFVFKANMIRNMEGHKIELSFVHTRNMSTVKRFIRIYLSFLNHCPSVYDGVSSFHWPKFEDLSDVKNSVKSLRTNATTISIMLLILRGDARSRKCLVWQDKYLSGNCKENHSQGSLPG